MAEGCEEVIGKAGCVENIPRECPRRKHQKMFVADQNHGMCDPKSPRPVLAAEGSICCMVCRRKRKVL